MEPTPQKSLDGQPDVALAQTLVTAYQKVTGELSKLIVGQNEVIEQILIAILSRGHCLLEGVPGLAKTLMVRGLAPVSYTHLTLPTILRV